MKQRILKLIAQTPGLTDREITNALEGPGRPQQTVNQTCRDLVRRGNLTRRKRPDGLIGNFLGEAPTFRTPSSYPQLHDLEPLSEDFVKRAVGGWLRDHGWETIITWGRERGIDIQAHRLTDQWIIEAKGCGISPQVQGNFFLNGLSELLQRMSDPTIRYSLAFPDLPRYRGLWERLPALVKERLRLSMLFVEKTGAVHEA
jgi:hypothetical protein